MYQFIQGLNLTSEIVQLDVQIGICALRSVQVFEGDGQIVFQFTVTSTVATTAGSLARTGIRCHKPQFPIWPRGRICRPCSPAGRIQLGDAGPVTLIGLPVFILNLHLAHCRGGRYLLDLPQRRNPQDVTCHEEVDIVVDERVWIVLLNSQHGLLSRHRRIRPDFECNSPQCVPRPGHAVVFPGDGTHLGSRLYLLSCLYSRRQGARSWLSCCRCCCRRLRAPNGDGLNPLFAKYGRIQQHRILSQYSAARPENFYDKVEIGFDDRPRAGDDDNKITLRIGFHIETKIGKDIASLHSHAPEVIRRSQVG